MLGSPTDIECTTPLPAAPAVMQDDRMSLLGFGWFRDELDTLRTAEPSTDPTALGTQVHALRTRVVELAATTTVLEALLVEAKAFDIAEVRRRVATILGATAVTVDTVQCVRCRRPVDIATTIAGSHGRICAAGCERA
jgi:hypothetical protein